MEVKLLHENGSSLFLVDTIDSQYWFGQNSDFSAEGGATFDIKEAKVMSDKLEMYKFAVKWCGKYAFKMITVQ